MSGYPIQVGTQNGQRFVTALDAAYRSGIWLPEQSYAEAQDGTIWEKLRRDAVCNLAIDMRLNKVAGRDPRVIASSRAKEDERLAEVVEEAFGYLDNHTAARRNIACAIFRGRSYGYVNWRRVPLHVGGLATTMDWFVPVAIEDVDPRMIRFVPVRERIGETNEYAVDVYAEMWSMGASKWVRLTPELWQNFVSLKYQDEQGRLSQGRGLQDALYFYSYAKSIVLREGLQGLERWAQGTVLAKIDGLRTAGTGKSNAEQSAAWQTELQKMNGSHAIVLDKSDEVSVMETSGTGHQLVMSMMQYLDDAIVRAATGSLLPSGGGSGGSNARAEVEQGASEDLVTYDRALLDEAFTRDLVGQFMRLNRPQIAAAGLLGARRPSMRAGATDRKDPLRAAQVASTALQAGIKLRADEVYDQLGFTPPNDDDRARGNVIEAGPSAGGGWNPFGGNPSLSRSSGQMEGGRPEGGMPDLLERLRRTAAEA